jgi:ATP-dependent Lhr-like helicase
VKHDRLRSVEVRKIDGEGLTDAPTGMLEMLRTAGFVDGYRGLTFRN